jgi:hypothetical protein
LRASILVIINLTPSVPLSFVPLSLKGEGEVNKKERRNLSWTLLIWGSKKFVLIY